MPLNKYGQGFNLIYCTHENLSKVQMFVKRKKQQKRKLYSIKLFARIFIRGNLAVQIHLEIQPLFLNSLAFA